MTRGLGSAPIVDKGGPPCGCLFQGASMSSIGALLKGRTANGRQSRNTGPCVLQIGASVSVGVTDAKILNRGADPSCVLPNAFLEGVVSGAGLVRALIRDILRNRDQISK